MLKQLQFTILFTAALLVSCTNKEVKPANRLKKINMLVENKKEGFNPLKHGFTCDSLNIQIQTKGTIIQDLVPVLGEVPIDTIGISSLKIQNGGEKDILIMDFNFDGFCDFILPDIGSASHGGMDYYFYLYNTENQNFKHIKSIPKFNGGVKLDIKNHRLKIYCPNSDCFAYYKYQENGTFKLVKGEFKVIP